MSRIHTHSISLFHITNNYTYICLYICILAIKYKFHHLHGSSPIYPRACLCFLSIDICVAKSE